MDDQPNFVTSPFDVIRHLEGEREFGVRENFTNSWDTAAGKTLRR